MNPLVLPAPHHHAATHKPDAAQDLRLPPTPPTSTSELAGLKIRLQRSLRQFPDFPSPGILFEDILPLFADAALHRDLLRALELHILEHHPSADDRPDVIVGLEARGFLFGPSLALRLGAGFVPVRKQGKLPGPTQTAGYEKEYGTDFFQIQADAIRPGQKVLVVDDIIATGGSAAAAGSLVRKLGGSLIGYVFILELDFLQGRQKLDAGASTLLSSQ
ncbi:adenine phosphoribosyltransferase [Xylographa opegraphella]|nr:adenine phosphoribosyltransferase [Xylographa opegraphella]